MANNKPNILALKDANGNNAFAMSHSSAIKMAGENKILTQKIQEVDKTLDGITVVAKNDNESVADGNRYIHLNGSYNAEGTGNWRLSLGFELETIKGCTIHFFRINKAANDMYSYALYSGDSSTNYIANSGYATSSNDSLTWGEVDVDTLLQQFPTAKWIRFTLATTYLNYPYATVKNGAERLRSIPLLTEQVSGIEGRIPDSKDYSKAVQALKRTHVKNNYQLSNDFNWVRFDTPPRHSEVYQVQAGDIIHLDAVNNYTYYAFLSAVGTQSATPVSERFYLASGESVDAVAPEGANYLYVTTEIDGVSQRPLMSKYVLAKDVTPLKFTTELIGNDNTVYYARTSLKKGTYIAVLDKTSWNTHSSTISESVVFAIVVNGDYAVKVLKSDIVKQAYRFNVESDLADVAFSFRGSVGENVKLTITETIDERPNNVLLDQLGATWEERSYISNAGEIVAIPSSGSNGFQCSSKMLLSDLSDYLWIGYGAFSTARDVRTWVLLDASDTIVSVASPNDLGTYKRLYLIDFSELAIKYPDAVSIRFTKSVNNKYRERLVIKGSIESFSYENKIALERPSHCNLDNFSFASADSNDIITVLSNDDATEGSDEWSGLNFAQILKIDGYYVCFYFAAKIRGEYNQTIYCAYSQDGTTWTRGFPTGVTPPVANSNRLFADDSDHITEACWFKVPDAEYPYRMIGNTNPTAQYGYKRCTMWKSSDGFNYTKVGQILDDLHRDTQYSAVVRGNVIKLYGRTSVSDSHGYHRNIFVAYLDLDGNILTPPHDIIYDYRYTSAACILDNERELLMPTWFSSNVDSAPKTQNCYLESFIVEGDKWEAVDTNINDCISEGYNWFVVCPSFVTINKEQYILVNEKAIEHDDAASGTEKIPSNLKLVKVSRT